MRQLLKSVITCVDERCGLWRLFGGDRTTQVCKTVQVWGRQHL